jgi:hypothetical protein
VLFSKTPTIGPHEVALAVRRGLEQLAAMQMPDGSFPLTHHNGRSPARQCHGLFSTLSILLALGDLLPPDVRSKALEFVAGQRSQDGTWHYDPDLKIPADSDTTACAVAALARYGHPIGGQASADLLRSFWRSDGGPFLTWRDAPQQWLQRDRDDAVVNCNVLLALRALGATPSALEYRAVIDLVNRSAKGTRYYCSWTSLGYAARRAGFPEAAINPRLLARPRHSDGVLPTAEWLSAVRRWDGGAVTRILSAQSAAGEWKSEDWCRDVGIRRWGSAAVTTALCVEALHTAAAAAQARPPRLGFRLPSLRSWPGRRQRPD